MVYDPRHIAFKILLLWETEKKPLDHIIQTFQHNLDSFAKRDRALANSIIFGTLRHKATLDWFMKHFINRPFEKVDIKVIWAIRIALFQIIYMDRIPVSAAVNTAVSIAKKECGNRTAGFANAVLRNAASNYWDVKFPDIEKTPARFLSVTRSVPLWLAERWIRRYGMEKSTALCNAINTIPPITVRTNTLKTDRETLFNLLGQNAKNISFTNYSKAGLSLFGLTGQVHEIQAFQEGLFQIQDEAAQLVSLILDPKPGETVLDLCAGLGGKTGHAGQLMGDRGRVVAVDIDKNKLVILEKEMSRLSVNIVETAAFDITKEHPLDFKNAFDKVLIDAPCSGLGVLRRNPDARWTKRKSDIKRLAQKQKEMLRKSFDLVKPGGTVVFAVCSCEKEENEEVINHCVRGGKNMILDKELPETNPIFDNSIFFEEGFFKSYPDAPFMDGFFAARLKKTM